MNYRDLLVKYVARVYGATIHHVTGCGETYVRADLCGPELTREEAEALVEIEREAILASKIDRAARGLACDMGKIVP